MYFYNMNAAQLIRLGFSLKKSYLHGLLTNVIDDNLKELDLEVNNILIHLERESPIAYQIEEKSIIIKCPLHVKLKRPSGLFTVEGEGKLIIDIKTSVSFSQNSLIAHSSLIGHEWIEKPILQLGSLNMPISTLANLLIDHSSAIITGRIDSAIKEHVRPHQLIDRFFFDKIEEFNRLPHNPIVLLPKVEGIMIRPFNDIKENIHVQAFIEGQLIATSGSPEIKERRYPEIEWLDKDMEPHKLSQGLTLTYDQIRKLISSFLLAQDFGGSGVEINKLDVSYDGSLHLKGEITKPVSMVIELKGVPVYNVDKDSLILKNMVLTTKPKSFLYQLVNPMVEKMIKSKIESAFPLAINQLLSDALKRQIIDVNNRSHFINIELEAIEITQAFFDKSGLNISLLLHEPSVNLYLTDNI
jgi:hypothetical protein